MLGYHNCEYQDFLLGWRVFCSSVNQSSSQLVSQLVSQAGIRPRRQNDDLMTQMPGIQHGGGSTSRRYVTFQTELLIDELMEFMIDLIANEVILIDD